MTLRRSFWKTAFFAENKSAHDLLLEVRMATRVHKWVPVKAGTAALIHADVDGNDDVKPGDIFDRIFVFSKLIPGTIPPLLWEPTVADWRAGSMDESRYARHSFTLVISDGDLTLEGA